MLHLYRRRYASALLLALAAIACGDDGATAPAQPRTITVALPTVDLFEGDTVTLRATVRDASGAEVPGAPVNWTVSDTLRAAVASNGIVTLFAPGAVTVTARTGSIAASRTLDIRRLSVQLVTVLPTTLQLGTGDVVVLGVRVQGEGGRDALGRLATITSDDPAIASIDAAGRVHAVAPGITTIRATVEGVTGTAEVEVRAENATLSLARVGGVPLPLPISADTVTWNGTREYHETFIEGGDLKLSGGATPRYAINVRYAEYLVTGPAGARTYTLRLAWREDDFGVVEYDARGDLRMLSEYISPLQHSASGVSGGIQVRFRIPGDDTWLDLYYRRE